MTSERQILFRDVRIFDGHNNGLSGPSHVLVRGELIEKISPDAIHAEGAAIIDDGKHDAIRILQEKYSYLPGLLLDYGVKVGYGSDTLGPPEVSHKCRRYEMHFRADWFGSRFEALKRATSVSGEILALSGPRNPYAKGPLGVVEPGAYADLLLVDGNPLEDLSLLGACPQWWEAPEPADIASMPLILKGGVLVKNTLPSRTDDVLFT